MPFTLSKMIKNHIRLRQLPASLATGTKVGNFNYSSRPIDDVKKSNLSMFSRWLKWLQSLKSNGKSKDMLDYVDEYEAGEGIVFVEETPLAESRVLLTDPSFCKDMYLRGIKPRMPIRKAILARDFYFNSRGMTVLSSSQGQRWRTLRSLVGPILFEDRYVNQYTGYIANTVTEFVKLIDFIRDKNTYELPNDFYKLVQRWSLETLGLITLNHKFGCLDLNLSDDSLGYKMHQTHLRLFEEMYLLEESLLWRFWPTPSRKSFYRDMDFIISVIRNLAESAKSHKSNNPLHAFDDGQKAMIYFLLENGMDIEDATAMIADLLSGGIETVANTIIATLYALATNQNCQEKLKAEIDSKPLKHKYLKACILEAMRLFPVVPANTRTLQTDTLIGNYQIPKGTMVVAAHGAMGLMAKYFDNPREFRPERWQDRSKKHPFAVLPFGHGSRICVAKRLADQMIQVVLAKLIQNYHFMWNGGEIKMKYQLHRQIESPLKFSCVKRSIEA